VTRKRNIGFTLVELLVVIAIIGVLVALLDGSAHTISEDIELDLWQGLSTRDGEEVVTLQ